VASPTALGNGSLTVSASAAVWLQTPALTVTAVDEAPSGLIDLGTGRIAVAAGGIAEAALRADLLAGRGDGTWSGTAGITSGSAAASAGSRAVGYVVNADTSVTVGFAAIGDTDLSGMVDLSDLIAILAAGKYGNGKAAGWGDGDFNYDGRVDLTDLTDLLAAGTYLQGNYLPQTFTRLTLPAQNAADLAAGFPVGEVSMVALVPEPDTATLLLGQAAMLAAALACRRRRLA